MRMSSRLLPALTLAVTAGVLAAPAEAASVDRHIWGVVVDGKGKAVLDAQVRALDEDGEVVASMRSYDDPDGDAAPRPGFFALYVPSNGTYDVVVKKKGFAPERLSDVAVTRNDKVVELDAVVLARSTQTAGKVLNEVRVGQKAVVKVTVTPAGLKPAGKARVTSANGRKTYGSATLKASHGGVVSVTLKELDKGTYDLRAVFEGSRGFADSTSSTFVLQVKGKKRDKRPNAVTWVA